MDSLDDGEITRTKGPTLTPEPWSLATEDWRLTTDNCPSVTQNSLNLRAGYRSGVSAGTLWAGANGRRGSHSVLQIQRLFWNLKLP
jgi:hypothetical protein